MIKYGPVTLLLLVLLSAYSHQSTIPLQQRVADEYGLAIEAIFSVGLRLQALLEEISGGKSVSTNFLVSPLSITMAIGQLMCGAEGTLQDYLYSLMSLPKHVKDTHLQVISNNVTTNYDVNYSKLHLQLSRLIKTFEMTESNSKDEPNFILNVSSVLFVKNNMRLYDTFKYYMGLYQTDIERLNFAGDPYGSQRYINNWAAAHTNNLIRSILSEPLPLTAAGVFANSIYFKADWETPFSSEVTRVGNFSITPTKIIPVNYMQGEFFIPYVENDLCRMIALPYKNNEIAMYIILPKPNNGEEYDIKSFVQKLTAKTVLDLKSKMKSRDVALLLPKMELSNSISILEPLKKYTIFKNITRQQYTQGGSRRPQPHHDNSDKDDVDRITDRVNKYKNFNASTRDVQIVLTAASRDKDLIVSNILQQMTLSVHEQGTEAAAITSTTIDYMLSSKIFRVERPFIFFISHEATSAALFWGTIVDPTRGRGVN